MKVYTENSQLAMEQTNVTSAKGRMNESNNHQINSTLNCSAALGFGIRARFFVNN
jgi:hypothetical protein